MYVAVIAQAGTRWFDIAIVVLKNGAGLIGLEIGSHDVGDCCFEAQARG